MKKKCYFLVILFFTFFKTNILNAQNNITKIISTKEFNQLNSKVYKANLWDTNLYNFILSVIFILFILAILWLLVEKKYNLRKTLLTIIGVFIFMLINTIISNINIRISQNKVSQEIINNISKKEPRFINKTLPFFKKNDYGFEISNIAIDSDILIKGKEYNLVYEAKQSNLLNLFSITSNIYVKTTFIYDSKNLIKIEKSHQEISADIKDTESNLYCFSEEKLNKLNGNIYLSNSKNEKYNLSKLTYNEIFSTKKDLYCSSPYKNKNISIISWDDNKISEIGVK